MLADPATEFPVELSYAQLGRGLAFLIVAMNSFGEITELLRPHTKLRDALLLESAVVGIEEITEREGDELRGDLLTPYSIHLRMTCPEVLGLLDALLACEDTYPKVVRPLPAAQQLKAKLELFLITNGGLDLPLHLTRAQLASAVYAAVETQTNKED